jgi:homoserine O-succinyltransferase/O-acetyltransferase
MTLVLERPASATDPGDRRDRRLHREVSLDRTRRLEIGILNNMPDAALASTERQFMRLLQDASQDHDVRLRFYALDSVPRSLDAHREMQGTYYRASSLRAARLDALIVSGAEPRAPSLPQEAYWRELVGIFDLARRRTQSTIFSCLAAHAAVLHWDAIARTPCVRKLSGVFATRVVRRHPLVDGMPEEFSLPHSRLNSLDEAMLASKGYETLVKSDQAGVDVFVKEEMSLLVFLQSHPEYDSDSLAREFRRDFRRYLAGERETPPAPPTNYFDADVLAEFEDLIERARRERHLELAACFPPAATNKTDNGSWRSNSIRLYRNWLEIIVKRKAVLQPSSVVGARAG